MVDSHQQQQQQPTASDANATSSSETEPPVTHDAKNTIAMMSSSGHSRSVSFRQKDLDRKDDNNNNNNNDHINNNSSNSNSKDSITASASSSRRALPKQNSAYNHIDLRTGMRTTRRQAVAVVNVVVTDPCSNNNSNSNNSNSNNNSNNSNSKHQHNPKKSAVHSRRGGSKQKLVQENDNGSGDDDETGDDNHLRHHHHPHHRHHHHHLHYQHQYRITSHAARGVYINNAIRAQKTHVVSNYLQWTFKASFLAVTLASFVQFTVLIILFAILIYWIDVYQPACLAGRVDTIPNFMDAYHLSWTTLATVGYGAVSPGLPSTAHGANCFGISILMAFEAFVGVLFVGFISAIIFSKVARVQSIAPITFSDPMLVRYGTGVLLANTQEDEEEEEDDIDVMSDDDDDDNVGLDNDKKKKNIDLPCPILEFRIVNDLWNDEGGEIINASLNMVASTDGAHKEFDDNLNGCMNTMYGINDNLMALGKAVVNVGTRTGQAIGHVGTKTGQAVASVGSKTGQAIGKTGQAIGSKTSMAVKSVLLGGGSSGNTMHSSSSCASVTSADTITTTTTSPPSMFRNATSPPVSWLRNGTASSGGSNAFTATGPPSFFRNGTAGSGGGSFIQKMHNSFSKTAPVDAHPGFAQAAAAAAQHGNGTDPYNQKQVTEEQINKELDKRLAHLASTGQLDGTVFLNKNRNGNVMRQSMAVEEGDSELVPPRIYHKLDLETDTHPFFRRVWIVRHVLNETSPLVSSEARRRIKENNGYWPEEYNNWQSVREHVNFLEIIVSCSGTMNVSGSNVYGLKVYDHVDMNIGYTFATLFTKDARGKMIVDKVLLNDVRAQAGGGEEPLQAQVDVDEKSDLLAMAEKYTVTAQAVTAAAAAQAERLQK